MTKSAKERFAIDKDQVVVVRAGKQIAGTKRQSKPRKQTSGGASLGHGGQ